MHPAMEQLIHLPLAERLALAQDLWDSIDEAREQFPLETWQRELALARLAEFDGREEELGLTEDQLWEEVDQRRGA